MKTVLQDDRTCYVCGNPYVEDHHIFMGTLKRKKAEKRGLKLWLCNYHHTGSDDDCPHHNREIDLKYKRMAQKYYEEHCGSREDFRLEFGKSYL